MNHSKARRKAERAARFGTTTAGPAQGERGRAWDEARGGATSSSVATSAHGTGKAENPPSGARGSEQTKQ
jgi:hypothetical protein